MRKVKMIKKGQFKWLLRFDLKSKKVETLNKPNPSCPAMAIRLLGLHSSFYHNLMLSTPLRRTCEVFNAHKPSQSNSILVLTNFKFQILELSPQSLTFHPKTLLSSFYSSLENSFFFFFGFLTITYVCLYPQENEKHFFYNVHTWS